MHFIILLFFVVILDVKSDSLSSDDCASMEITYVAKEFQNEQTVRIELNVKGGSEPYYFIFFDNRNNPLSWDFKKSYYIVEHSQYPQYAKVRDAEGCIKIIEFNERINK